MISNLVFLVSGFGRLGGVGGDGGLTGPSYHILHCTIVHYTTLHRCFWGNASLRRRQVEMYEVGSSVDIQ